MEGVVFPVHISQGSVGGPDWLVEEVLKVSGHSERNTPWSAPLRTYDARYAVRTYDELDQILHLYHVAGGPLRGFLLQDWTDYRSRPPLQAPTPLDQALGTGDGVTTAFPLVKRYSFGGHHLDRPIAKPRAASVLVAVDGVAQAAGWSVSASTGTVSFDAAPAVGAALTWGGEFHVPVHFRGKLDLTMRSTIGDIPSILLEELRL